MKSWLNRMLWVFLGCIVLIGCAQQAQSMPEQVDLQPQPAQAETPVAENELQVVVFCSPERLRTPAAVISWRTGYEEAQAQELDVTSFKRGFELDAFGTLSPTKPGDRLLISVLDKNQQASMESLQRLEFTRSDYDRQNAVISVEILNLEPGVNYFWRLRVGDEPIGQIIKSEAPICVADEEEEK